MPVNLPLIAATTVGSFPRPEWLAERDRNDIVFRLEGEALREAQDDATTLILREQATLGLDLVTDGEQRRTGFINHLLSQLEGVDMVNRGPKEIRRKAGNWRDVPRVVGKIQRRGPIMAEEVRFARGHSDRPLKMAVPGPLTVVDTTYDDAYGNEEALAMDVAAVLNAELLDMQAAGCDVIQLDEPAMTRYHEKVEAFAARALDRCLEGVTVPTIVHLCYGYPGTGPAQHEYTYPDLLTMLMQTRIGGFSVEFARSDYDPAILKVCEGRLVMYGCVDPGDTPPEPLDVVVGRVKEVLRYVEPANLLIAPDCGLMTLTRDLAHQKAALLVAAAEQVRAAL
jgi:5-methyltetrahydropteroyltriglutamate--homocysteine methyltransferase